MKTSETEIQNKVYRFLERDDRIRSKDIRVDVEGSSVRIEGKVPNYTALKAAENDAYMVMGVRTVDNYLSIEPPETGDKPDDLEVEAALRSTLLWDNRIDPTDIELVVTQGHVELNGTVYSLWEKQISEDIAHQIKGIKEVTNNLVVNSQHDLNDTLIADKVFEAIDTNPFVNAGDIDIVINNGMVTINGTVQSYQAANKVYDTLLYIPGVRGIINNISQG